VRPAKALTTVTPPAGGAWTFVYNTSGSAGTGLYNLNKATNPIGGTIQYYYKPVDFNTGSSCSIEFSVLDKRVLGGTSVTSGTYTYSYTNPGQSESTISIAGPNSQTETHKYYGWNGSGYVWRVGRPKEITITYGGQTVKTTYIWTEGSEFSYDDTVSTNYSDCYSYLSDTSISYVYPNTTSTVITRSSSTHTTTSSSPDNYGNPTSVSESGQRTRTTTYSYWYDTDTNMVTGKPATVSYSDSSASAQTSGTRDYTYEDNTGLMLEQDLYGVVTSYDYDSYGNLYSVTNDRNYTTLYKSYSYGLPTIIDYPHYSSNVTREIYWYGLVKSEKNARGYSTGYEYDKIKRLTKYTPPSGGDTTSISWSSANKKTVTVGSYVTDYTFNGFGWLTKIYDNQRKQQKTLTYNANGSLTGETYTYDTLTGETKSYDKLGRLTQFKRPDSSRIDYSYSIGDTTQKEYSSGGSLLATTTFTFQAYGTPEDC